MSSIQVGLQLYTVRDETAKDFIGTLRQVAKMGYAGVEIAGNGGLGAQELKTVLDDLGLKAVGSHIGPDRLEKDLPAVIAFEQTIGSKFITCPYAPKEWMDSEARCKGFAERLNRIGAACHEAGLQLLYHNHAHEFLKIGDQYALDVLLAAVDPALVQPQLDVYWVKYAGEDPVSYLHKYAGRLSIVHLKDMDPSDRSFTEVGNGLLDMEAIMQASLAGGARWGIVEQDTCKRPTLESARISLENLRSRGLA